jgi:hypothetical protein
LAHFQGMDLQCDQPYHHEAKNVKVYGLLWLSAS